MQLITDGLPVYVELVDESFGKREVDFAQLVKKIPRLQIKRKKFLSHPHELKKQLAELGATRSKKTVACRRPELDHISTGFIERHNITVRMNIKWFG